MDLLGVKNEMKEAIQDTRAALMKADRVLDNAVAITDDIRAITSMLRAALVKDR